MACHMQACLVLKQFEYILNVTEYVNENYLRIKEKFLRAIDYVENINMCHGACGLAGRLWTWYIFSSNVLSMIGMVNRITNSLSITMGVILITL